MTEDILKRYSSRKFWAMVVFQFAFIALLCYGILPVSVFESLTWMLLGGYFVGNISQKVLLSRGEEK